MSQQHSHTGSTSRVVTLKTGLRVTIERKTRERDGLVYFNAFETDGYQGVGMCIGLGDNELDAVEDLLGKRIEDLLPDEKQVTP